MKVLAVVTPAKAGVHLGKTDSRFRGNDLTLEAAKRGIAALEGSGTAEILRFAQNDSKRVGSCES